MEKRGFYRCLPRNELLSAHRPFALSLCWHLRALSFKFMNSHNHTAFLLRENERHSGVVLGT